MFKKLNYISFQIESVLSDSERIERNEKRLMKKIPSSSLSFSLSHGINPFLDYPLSNVTDNDVKCIEAFCKQAQTKSTTFLFEKVDQVPDMLHLWNDLFLTKPNDGQNVVVTYDNMLMAENVNNQVQRYFCQSITNFNELSDNDKQVIFDKNVHPLSDLILYYTKYLNKLLQNQMESIFNILVNVPSDHKLYELRNLFKNERGQVKTVKQIPGYDECFISPWASCIEDEEKHKKLFEKIRQEMTQMFDFGQDMGALMLLMFVLVFSCDLDEFEEPEKVYDIQKTFHKMLFVYLKSKYNVSLEFGVSPLLPQLLRRAYNLKTEKRLPV